jgi:uncharacterized coiled-coil protein SlyX
MDLKLDLTGILVPVVVAFIVTAGGAWAIRKYAGPAQTAYVSALVGRNQILENERSDQEDKIKELIAKVDALRQEVENLRGEVRELTSENLELRRRLDNRPPRPRRTT